MSGKPSPSGAKQVIRLVREIDRLLVEELELVKTKKRLSSIIKEKSSLRQELDDLLKSMDTANTGNYGWEGRIGWLFAEVVRQVSDQEKTSPYETSPLASQSTLKIAVSIAAQEGSLLDALTSIAAWESDRAVHQALEQQKTSVSTAARGSCDTCFRTSIAAVLNKFEGEVNRFHESKYVKLAMEHGWDPSKTEVLPWQYLRNLLEPSE